MQESLLSARQSVWQANKQADRHSKHGVTDTETHSEGHKKAYGRRQGATVVSKPVQDRMTRFNSMELLCPCSSWYDGPRERH